MKDREQGARCDICGEESEEEVPLTFYPVKHEDRPADLYRALVRFEKVDYGEEGLVPLGDARICLRCFLMRCIDKLPRNEARLTYRDGHHAYEE